MATYVWDLSQPMYNAFSYNPNQLGVDYTTGVDNRWPDALRLGPNRYDLDLSAVDGATPANLNSSALIQRTAGGTEWFLYVGNGNRAVKIQWTAANGLLTTATTQQSDVSGRVMSLLVTKHPGGNPMLSIAQDGDVPFDNATAIAAENASDTVSENNEAKVCRILGHGPDREYALDRQTIAGNILTSTVTMDASAFATLATFTDANIKPTGFAMSDNLVMWGTNIGALVLHAQYREFFPAFGAVPASADNCRAMRFIPWLGVLVPLVGQIRLQNGDYSERVGPEVWGSPNVIQGTVTGIGYDASWAYLAMRNPNNSTTYILAARPRQAGDWQSNPISYYCIATFGGACEHLDVPHDAGAIRTNPLLIAGNVGNLSYYRLGLGQNWSDDANYQYMINADQSIWGTWLRCDSPKSVHRMGVTLDNLASGRPVTVEMDYVTETGGTGTHRFTKEIKSGHYALDTTANMKLERVVAFRPKLTLRSDAEAQSPEVRPRVIVLAEDSR